MPTDADFELGLRWDRDRTGLDVTLRIEIPETETDDWQHVSEPLEIDLDVLRSLSGDEEAYAQKLTRMVLGLSPIGEFYTRARAAADVGDRTLNLRLHLDAPGRFHAIRWELLRDPETGTPIATRSNIVFSRYLTSSDWRPIPVLPRHELRALIVVAGPKNVQEYGPQGRPFAAVRVEDEVQRARAALRSFQRTELAHGDATLAKITDALGRGVDVLYLVCHGALVEEVPYLALEHSDGTAHFVDGRTLVERLSEIDRRPTVALLCSCQSAGGDSETRTADEGDLSALGPRLAAAGVAAVVAMQGNISMRTMADFSPTFFEALSEHGVVGRAMSAARLAIIERPDWWVPVLFSRLRSGRTYYVPEFPERGPMTWASLSLEMKTGDFTPVLGPGLAASILGSRQEVASDWVRRWQIPLTRQNQGDLTQVAQYLRVRSAPGIVRMQLKQYLREEISRRRTAHEGEPAWELPASMLEAKDSVPAILEVGRRLRESDSGDPYRVVASFPVDTYVTTGWTDLLEEALREQVPPREPISMTFPWADDSPADSLTEADPSPERPLVYHLFGRLDDPDSVVLTEDDYFAWLIAWIIRRKDVPPAVRKALTSRSLLFLGYRLDDWDFRVVFQGIKSFGGSSLLLKNLHVGVQLSPENSMLEPEAAQGYLESYFGKDNVSIYWGETRKFLDELRARTELRT